MFPARLPEPHSPAFLRSLRQGGGRALPAIGSVTRRSTGATVPAGAESVPPTSPPTRCARTASRPAGTRPRWKSTTCSRWSTAAPTTPVTFAPCVSRATPASRRSTATDGGKPQGSTPTEISATFRPDAAENANLKVADLDLVRRTRGNVAALAKGWGLLISTTRSRVSGRGQPHTKSPNQTGY